MKVATYLLAGFFAGLIGLMGLAIITAPPSHPLAYKVLTPTHEATHVKPTVHSQPSTKHLGSQRH